MLTIQKKSVNVGKYVNTDHVDTVIRNYKQERWVNNSKHIGKEDSLSGWYSLSELEEFLETVKMYGADGIRFYFAAYPAEYPENPVYAGRQTFVMVATKSKETENGIVDKDIYVATDKGNSILAYNQSKLCPPYCKPGFDSDDLGITLIDKGDDGLLII